MSRGFKTSAEVHFAQQLACNEKKVRDKCLKKVRRWLTAKSASTRAFSEDDMLKLWKGLFYFFWMCDKPLIQEEMATEISQLIHCFQNVDASLSFIDAFFQTMSREWFGIDRFRLEKFMMLVRRFLRECFELMRKQKWKLKCIRKFRKLLKKNVLNPLNDSAPLGLKLHIVDIYMEELAKTGGKELTPKFTQRFLVPYCHILASSDNPIFLSSVTKDVFHFLIHQSALNDDESEKDEQSESVQQLESDEKLPIIQFDPQSVIKMLMKFASKDSVKRKNRRIIYKSIKSFRDFSEGFNSLDRQFNYSEEGPKLKKRQIIKATETLLEEDKKFKEEKLNWKKSKKANE